MLSPQLVTIAIANDVSSSTDASVSLLVTPPNEGKLLTYSITRAMLRYVCFWLDFWGSKKVDVNIPSVGHVYATVTWMPMGWYA